MTSSKRRKAQATSWFSVVRAYQECTRQYSRLLGGFGLTIPQFDVLTAIHQLAGEATPKAIADRLVVTRGNITGLLHRLHEKGLVTTRRNQEDGRSFLCELTGEGRDLLARAQSAAALFIEEQLSPFDDATLERTERLMNQMRSHLETMDPDAIAARAPTRRQPGPPETARR